TTHRLLWFSSSSSSSAAPPVSASIPLASITHMFSPKKSIKSIFTSHRIRFQVTATDSRSVVIKVVVRGKVDWDGFLGNVWDCWRGRAWETFDTSERPCASGGLYDGSVRMVGVAGILRKEQEMWETTDKSLQDAFQDLNALMSTAKEMVMLAEKMRQKLLSGSSTQTSSTNEDEIGSKEEMHDWLLTVGIVSPVTKESAGALYHQQLSRQVFSSLSLLI
ncbi:LOW QUALITY PROTEIN: EAP30 domain-containing protein, partial [Cephalotus follicularis]